MEPRIPQTLFTQEISNPVLLPLPRNRAPWLPEVALATETVFLLQDEGKQADR